MKHLLSTTAIVLMTALPLQAEQHTGATMDMQATVALGDAQMSVSKLMDAKVYMAPAGAEGSSAAGAELAEIPSDWTEIGTIEDVFVSEDGQMTTVVVEPGGDVETEADRVALKPEALAFAKIGGEDGDIAVIFNGDMSTFAMSEAYDPARLEEMGERSAMDAMADDIGDALDDAADATAAAAEDAATAVGDAADDAARATEGAVAELTADDPVEGEVVTAEDLDGAPVYDLNGEEIGEISKIIVADDGQIDKVVIDVGGFLGIGEKPVALTFDELRITRGEGMEALRVEVDHTEAELKDMPDWTE